MKHLFFVAVATGIFAGTSISLKAQTNVNLERFAEQSKPKTSLKFIEGIEITPDKISNNVAIVKTDKAAIIMPVAPGSTVALVTIEQCAALQFKYAMLMDREVERINNFSLYSFIEEWWGTRYRYGGTNKKGIDCSSFTGKLMLAVYNINVPRIAKDQFDVCEKISKENLKEGDLVFFNTRGGVSHVGFYLGDNYFAHSSVSSGVTISSLTDDYYSRKFIGGGRVSK